jgi:Fe2+ or Zn2+ uptake regulation protein
MKEAKTRLYREISDLLSNDHFNIHQLTERLKGKASWETVNNALEIMMALGIVQKQQINGRYIYSLNQKQTLNRNAILGLPVTKEAQKLACQIAKRFKEKKDVNNTFLQKMVVELIKREKLDIPYGYYLYGECCIQKLNCIDDYKSTNAYDKEIDSILKDFEKYHNTDELLQEKYIEAHNDLYLHRLKINNVLSVPFTTQNLILLDLELRHLIFSYKLDEYNNEIDRLLHNFYSIFVQLKKKPIDEIETIRMEIFTCFKSVWELIGTHQLFTTTKERFYKTHNTLPNYQYAVEQLIEVAEIHLEHLYEHVPPYVFSEKTKKLRETLGV